MRYHTNYKNQNKNNTKNTKRLKNNLNNTNTLEYTVNRSVALPVVAGLGRVDDMAWRHLNHIVDLCYCLLGRLCHVKMKEVLEVHHLHWKKKIQLNFSRFAVSDLGFHFWGHSVPVNNSLGDIPVFWETHCLWNKQGETQLYSLTTGE